MRCLAWILLTFSTLSSANMVPNTEMLKLYEEQVSQTRSLISELNEVMQITGPIFGIYKHMNGSTPESVALTKHLLQIQEQIDELYGKPPTVTPFSSCRTITGVAYDYWLEKMRSIHSKNDKQLDLIIDHYKKLAKECSKQVKVPPPKMVEELGIVEVAP